MYEESYLKEDYFYQKNRTEMCVESVDVVTSYVNDQQNLKVAVSVLSLCGEPVRHGNVDLVINSPNGSKFSLSKSTDSNGVALFELCGVERGRWEAVVFGVNHPEYHMSKAHCNQRWTITYV
ncbi:MAG: hypothetical protein JW779_02035 [Candidatus Thorarchaeota archaeon]|nr:hypothetical protein [Candidatus Thorarchaeota archaeon]